MVSDQQPHGSVPSTPEHYRPVIPGRSSSISARTWDRSVQERSRGAFRHSMIDDSAHRFNFFDNSLEATNRTPDLCYAMGRTSRSASCSEPTRNTPESTKVQRWAGLTRSVSNWDGLRKVSSGQHTYVPSVANNSRIPSYGCKMAFVQCISMRAERHVEDHHSVFH
jgi:hypothetical protein